MIGIGQILQEARLTLGYSVDDMHQKTNIHIEYLIALEEERFSKLPSPFYARGFLRAYARSLKLDPKHLLNMYETQVMKQKIPQTQITHTHSLQLKRGSQQPTMHTPVSSDEAVSSNSTSRLESVQADVQSTKDGHPLLFSEPLAPRREVIGAKDKQANQFIFWTIGIIFFVLILILIYIYV